MWWSHDANTAASDENAFCVCVTVVVTLGGGGHGDRSERDENVNKKKKPGLALAAVVCVCVCVVVSHENNAHTSRYKPHTNLTLTALHPPTRRSGIVVVSTNYRQTVATDERCARGTGSGGGTFAR